MEVENKLGITRDLAMKKVIDKKVDIQAKLLEEKLLEVKT